MPDDDTTVTADASQANDAVMADDSDEVQDPETAAEEIATEDEAAVAQADKPDSVKKAIRRHQEAARAERKRADEAEAKVKAFEDAAKTEKERTEERAVEAEKKAQAAEQKLLRLEVAGSKKLPAKLASRLTGETKAELEADADELLKLVKDEDSVSVDGGARKTSKTSPDDMNSRIRQMAGRS